MNSFSLIRMNSKQNLKDNHHLISDRIYRNCKILALFYVSHRQDVKKHTASRQHAHIVLLSYYSIILNDPPIQRINQFIVYFD